MIQPSLNINGLNAQGQSLNSLDNLNNAANTNSSGNNKKSSSQTINDNNVQTFSTGNDNTQNSNNPVKNIKTKEKELSNQIQSDLNPSPMLPQAMLYKWDYSAGGAVVNIVDFKTGKVLAQIPPDQVLKTMSNYQKGSLYNNKM